MGIQEYTEVTVNRSKAILWFLIRRCSAISKELQLLGIYLRQENTVQASRQSLFNHTNMYVRIR